MTARSIVLWPDLRLNEICAPVTAFDSALETLVRDMFETMYEAPGRGLAAPQIGVMQRVFVMDAGWKEGDMRPIVCINPSIVASSEQRINGEEACLSIPGVAAEVERAAEIELAFSDLNGAPQHTKLKGFDAICAQHELDHLDGKVIFDRINARASAALQTLYKEQAA